MRGWRGKFKGNCKVNDARLKNRRPLQRQRQRRPAKAGRYKFKSKFKGAQLKAGTNSNTKDKVNDARLKGRRPLLIQNQLQRRPAEAGRYKVKCNGNSNGKFKGERRRLEVGGAGTALLRRAGPSAAGLRRAAPLPLRDAARRKRVRQEMRGERGG